MKRVFLFLAVIGLVTLSAFSQKKETRNVSGFTGIDASSAFDITVTKGGPESLTIEADDEIMPFVRSEVKQGVLHLYIDKDKTVKNIKTLKASVVMKNLNTVSLSGACKLSANDLFTPDEFKGNCSGASNLNLNLNTKQVNIGASGASNIQLKADVVNDVRLNMSGTSKVQTTLKATNVQISNSGVSTVDMTGSASDIKIDMSGTSNIKAVDFVVKTATIESSGTSNVSVNVTDALKVNSSGASSVNYKGSPTIDANNSGASRVKKIQ